VRAPVVAAIRIGRGVGESVHLLAARPLRTALSVSGLLVGGAAVIVMVAVAEGAEQRVLTRLQALGTNVLVVAAAPARPILDRPGQAPTHTLLRESDGEIIRRESGLATATAPAIVRTFIVRAGPLNTSTLVLGTTPEGLDIRNIRADAGRLFTHDDDAAQSRVVLLGPTVVRNLFGDANPIGSLVRIGSAPFEVIGVTRPQGVDPAGVDQDNRVLVPLRTAMRRLLNIPYVDAVYVQAGSSDDLARLEREVAAILQARLGSRSGLASPFVVQNSALLVRSEREAALAMTQLIAVVAGATLLLGAVGIVTMMLISIRERTSEIGLRRALGARQRDIRRQFLIESAVLAALGGSGGVAVGTLAAVLAAVFGPWELVMSWSPAILALVCSAVLGIAAGVIPAMRAASLEPIVALRAS
jgi:putative ABC transport system permease protein